jgi:hypothetical protein
LGLQPDHSGNRLLLLVFQRVMPLTRLTVSEQHLQDPLAPSGLLRQTITQLDDQALAWPLAKAALAAPSVLVLAEGWGKSLGS